MDLLNFNKFYCPSDLIRVHFQNIFNDYQDYLISHTDGFETEVGVESAVFHNNKLNTLSLPNRSSIYTAEVYTIWQALMSFNFSSTTEKLLICSDSSSLLSLRNMYSQNLLIKYLQALIHSLQQLEKIIVFLWLPGQICNVCCSLQ